MRKRLFALFACAVLLLSLSACSGNEGFTPTTFSDGSKAYYSGNHLNYSMKTIPFDMTIEEKSVPLCNTSFFEYHADHGYTAYFIASLDRSNLSDDDIYWLTKFDDKKHCKTIDFNVYAYSEKNELSTDPLHLLGIVYDDEYIYYSFCSDHCRYSFLDGNFSCQIIITPTGITESDTVYYYYDFVIDSSNYADSVDSLTLGERDAFHTALNN